MEKVLGYSLSEIVAAYRQRAELPSYILVVDWFEQAFRALATMHTMGRIHLSIGPEKIFVGADDEVRIDEGGAMSDFARGWTATGPAGESGCAAPEQLSGRSVDQRTDLYSLGAAFYELLTLRRPGTSPDPPSSINRTVPKDFDALLLRLLAAAPEDRYASPDEVLAGLAALRRSPNSMAAPALVAAAGQAVRPAGVPRAAMIAAGAVLGAIGGAIAGWLLSSSLPATIVVGAIVGGIVGVFANPNA
ncbi:MAG: protein kinase domain-containing protein [Thermoguttaceae bacterium]